MQFDAEPASPLRVFWPSGGISVKVFSLAAEFSQARDRTEVKPGSETTARKEERRRMLGSGDSGT